LFITAIILLVTLVNPNNFKNQISSAVQKNTGREFAINGDIKWSFFPWLGLRINQIALGNAPGFNQEPFAQVGEADINIRLLPLFSGKVKMGTVTFRDLTMHLIKNVHGQNNWSDIASSNKTNLSEQTNSYSISSTSKFNAIIPAFFISNVDIDNATITWDDQQSGQKATIRHFNFNGRDINFSNSFPIKLKLDVSSNQPALNAQIAFASLVMVDPVKQQFSLHNPQLNGNLLGKQYAQGKVPFDFTMTNFVVDLKQQTVQAEDMVAEVSNLKAQGNLSGNKILQTPVFESNLIVPTFNLKTFLTNLGQKIQTQDSQALQTATLKAQVQLSPKFIKFNNLQANLDDTTLTGNFNANFPSKSFDFNLKLNQIDLSRYSLSASSTKPTDSETNLSSAATTLSTSTGTATSETLPLKLLRQLNGQGTFQIDKLTVAKMTTTNVYTKLTANHGIIKISPVTTNLYQGKSQGSITLNLQGNMPLLTANENLNGIQVEPLISDISKTNKIHITGTGNVNINLQAQGQNTDAMVRTLNGNIKFAVNNGTIKNVNVGQQIYASLAHVLKRDVYNGPAADNETNFTTLTGTIVIANGIANNNDLLLQSTALKATGQGSANLINQSIDYGLKATALGSPFGRDILDLQQQIGGSIPIRISGNLSDPKIGPDYATIGGALFKKQVKQQIEKHLGNGLGKALENFLGQ
jgi:AsmA protein